LNPPPGSTDPESRLRLRLVASRGPPYPSRSPRAHPSGWTRTDLEPMVSSIQLSPEAAELAGFYVDSVWLP